ncbi:CoA-binding protein [Segnochrobactraceae bacterium EtOH-i3]
MSTDDTFRNPPDDEMRAILAATRVIAVVGASPKPERPSYDVMRFLLSRGYRVIPVNPGQAGKEILGCPVVAALADIGEPIDMVDVFRTPDQVDGIVTELLALEPRPKTLWLQIDVIAPDAAARALAAGVDVVMDRCPKIELMRRVRSPNDAQA